MIVALAGGVGGAKLVAGLAGAVEPEDLAVVVNTADDFEFLGLHVSPDLDTITYTLAGLANPQTGWGLAGDTFQMLEQLGRLDWPTWFRVGDRDLAMHLARTACLGQGLTLTETTRRLAGALGVRARVLPMCDGPVRTVVDTPVGVLPFQEYFVQRRYADEVLGVRFQGVEQARPTAEVAEAVARATVVVLCPSNPVVSIGPILAVPGLRQLLRESHATHVAVSPIVGGEAVSGPAGRMMAGLGHEVSVAGVARMYRDVIDGIVVDEQDRGRLPEVEGLGLGALAAPAIMRTPADRADLARAVLRFAAALKPGLSDDEGRRTNDERRRPGG